MEAPVVTDEQLRGKHIVLIARELTIKTGQVRATADLLAEGGTVPFIARYRKEATGSLDEVAVTTIRDRLEQLFELDKRRAAILASLIERGLLTDELKDMIMAAETMTVLEDIYLPYRPKRRTRATIAKEKGLEPLALSILAQDENPPLDVQAEAARYIDEEKGVASVEEALAGARDIVAEMISEHQDARARVRDLFLEKGDITSAAAEGKEAEGAKYKDYFEWSESVKTAPSHRILAMLRGEKEKFLRLVVEPPEAEGIGIVTALFVKNKTQAAGEVRIAVEDGYKRLLAPSIETETRNALKQRADGDAISVFAANVRELLLASPLGGKSVLAIDPGYRTGCKVVCLDNQGKLLKNETIYPHTGGQRAEEAGKIIEGLVERFGAEIIAVGNGTAGRETESFVKGLSFSRQVPVVIVNESGASIYSASEAAREEFPDYDVTVRGAVSIGRRLMDPLSELVKIDPKSIGVGQYQHDVDQGALRKSLDDVVESCVNGVGVDLNTASKQLLTYISGLGPSLAKRIIEFRNTNGAFSSREEIKKVAGLGPKAFEQAAGFLRIRNGDNPLDKSAVHPESYSIVDRMAADLGCSVSELMGNEDLRTNITLDRYVTDTVGLPTLRDIMAELARPGRDPRDKFEPFSFADGINTMEDLAAGMKLAGIVTNVTAFGAFVDIGVHQDGLVHISQLADRFVKDPAEVVKVHQRVSVTVIEVDIARKRISLSMRSDPFKRPDAPVQKDRDGRGKRFDDRPRR
ncbi:MAG: RNA-binding transcriptional accessory protein [Deltaproteobacteria bacterium]|nr:RNA-binding transcriptional accessory protein [Candidatus Zymogenaceae bacterium]